MKQTVSKSSSWSEVYEKDGFKLSVSSSNRPLVYFDSPNPDHGDGKVKEGHQDCWVLSEEQLYQLRAFVDHAIRDLEANKRWPKKPVMRGK